MSYNYCFYNKIRNLFEYEISCRKSNGQPEWWDFVFQACKMTSINYPSIGFYSVGFKELCYEEFDLDFL